MSRIITKLRWVVESCHARMKQFRYFAQANANSTIESEHQNLHVLCALTNCFKVRLLIYSEQDYNTGIRMRNIYDRDKSIDINPLGQFVEEQQFTSRHRVKAVNMIAEPGAINFPRLSKDDIIDLCAGIFQLRRCKGYAKKHILNTSEKYEYQTHTTLNNLLRVKIQSLHTSTTMYTTFVDYQDTKNMKGYCTCKSGARTLGFCAHICSFIWWLGYGMYKPKEDILDSFLDKSIAVTWGKTDMPVDSITMKTPAKPSKHATRQLAAAVSANQQ